MAKRLTCVKLFDMAKIDRTRWLTDDEIKKIEMMAGWHMTLDQMAALIGIASITLDRRLADQEGVREAYARGKAKSSLEVRSVAYNLAISGNHPGVTMFWLRCKENFEEKDINLENAIIKSLSDDELINLSERALRQLKEKDPHHGKKPGQDDDTEANG